MIHIPVLQKEVIEQLNPKPDDKFIDCTFGAGGHARAILEKIRPKGKLLGIERDSSLYKKAEKIEGLILVNDNYAHLKEIAEEHGFLGADGILIDLGLSTWHFEGSGRGFSFSRNEPLDMRYSNEGLKASDILNRWKFDDIERILTDYGEEKYAGKITKMIIEERKDKKIETTVQLNDIIRKAVPYKKDARIHPSTRVFQALRIAVNDELGNLEKVLPQIPEVLKSSGKVGIISFHSLEDRIVKNFFKNCAEMEVLTKKPIVPSFEEIKNNKSARSAKLRIAIKK